MYSIRRKGIENYDYMANEKEVAIILTIKEIADEKEDSLSDFILGWQKHLSDLEGEYFTKPDTIVQIVDHIMYRGLQVYWAGRLASDERLKAIEKELYKILEGVD